MTIPKVSIVILHFKNVSLLYDCLESCERITYPRHEIIIVNNGGRSNLTQTEMQKRSDHVTEIINHPENIGYARANNFGIQKALHGGAHYVLLLNDDTSTSPDFLNSLVEIGEKAADVGMLGPAIYYFDEPDRIWFAGARFERRTCTVSMDGFDQFQEQQDSGPVESDYITGCTLLVKKEVIETIGLLNEDFFLYWEDVDWGIRAMKAGFKNLIVPSAHIWHKISVSAGGPDSPLKVYHKTRSHLYMAKLHTPYALPRLQRAFLRDIAWLLLKSSDESRIKKAMAYLVAIMDYYRGRKDRGPHWLWRQA